MKRHARIRDGAADWFNCIYVDKTDYFHRLVTSPGRNLFFIARPRRFGKSLMITTFKYIFEGRRELFRGLKIDKTDYDWRVHPVIHLDFSFCAARTHAELMEGLPNTVEQTLRTASRLPDRARLRLKDAPARGRGVGADVNSASRPRIPFGPSRLGFALDDTPARSRHCAQNGAGVHTG